VVVVSCSDAARTAFFAGYSAMMERLEPRNVLIYSRKLDADMETSAANALFYPPFYREMKRRDAKGNRHKPACGTLPHRQTD